MRSIVIVAALVTGFCATASGDYSRLIATSDAQTVYFEVRTVASTYASFAVYKSSSGLVVQPEEALIEDANASGTVTASSHYLGPRTCRRSTDPACLFSPSCLTGFDIHGSGFTATGGTYATQVRLDRSGLHAWIYQTGGPCVVPGTGTPAPLRGLYEVPTLRRLFGSDDSIANQRSGRRVITDDGRVLSFHGIQLQWLDGTGAHAIRHVASAFEGVTDATGENVAYVEDSVGKLHWIAVSDEDLGLTGAAPALTDDGRILVFLGTDQSLMLYDRSTRSVRRLASDTFQEFTIGGDSVFGVTSDGRLVQVALSTGEQSTWLEPFASISYGVAPPPSIGGSCQSVCYGPTDLGLEVSPGMILILHGDHLDQPGLRASFGTFITEMTPLSDDGAWLQVPSQGGLGNLSIFNAAYPVLTFTKRVVLVDRVAVCLGTLHSDFSHPVTAADPALPGEIIHVFLTGLRGAQPVPYGIPNPPDALIPLVDPPQLADPGAANILFFGLAPDLIGIQQLDLKVERPFKTQSLFAGVDATCISPSVAFESPE